MLDFLKHYTMDKGYADILEKGGWTWNFIPNFAGREMYDITVHTPLEIVTFCIDLSDPKSFSEQMQIWADCYYDYKRNARSIRSWYKDISNKDISLKECRESAKYLCNKMAELIAGLKQYESEAA